MAGVLVEHRGQTVGFPPQLFSAIGMPSTLVHVGGLASIGDLAAHDPLELIWAEESAPGLCGMQACDRAGKVL